MYSDIEPVGVDEQGRRVAWTTLSASELRDLPHGRKTCVEIANKAVAETKETCGRPIGRCALQAYLFNRIEGAGTIEIECFDGECTIEDGNKKVVATQELVVTALRQYQEFSPDTQAQKG